MKRDLQKIKQVKRLRRKARIRARVSGNTVKPRLSVFRSLKHIYAQLIDDVSGKTLVAVSDSKLGKRIIKTADGLSSKAMVAREVGKLLAEKSKEKGIHEAVFDRSFYKYHGRIKALADGAKEGGLKF